jgi:hypothetical protein
MKPDLLFDVRLVDRNVTRGRMTQVELDKHLAELPDTAEQAANLEASLAERAVVAPEPVEAAAPDAKAAPKKSGK